MLLHKGKVVEIQQDKLKVLIERSDACVHCEAQKLCGMNKTTSQIYEIKVAAPQYYKIGDIINIELNPHLGMVALFLCYVMPLLLMILSLVISDFFIKNEIICGIISIIILIPYYFLLFLGKKYFNEKFTFNISATK